MLLIHTLYAIVSSIHPSIHICAHVGVFTSLNVCCVCIESSLALIESFSMNISPIKCACHENPFCTFQLMGAQIFIYLFFFVFKTAK